MPIGIQQTDNEYFNILMTFCNTLCIMLFNNTSRNINIYTNVLIRQEEELCR